MITKKIITKEKFELAKALIDKGTFKQLSATRMHFVDNVRVVDTFSLKAKKFSAATAAEVTVKPDLAPFRKELALATGSFALGLAVNQVATCMDLKLDSISIAPTGPSLVFKPIENQTKFDYSGTEHKVQNDITEDLQTITQLQLKQKQLAVTKVLYETIQSQTTNAIEKIVERQQVSSMFNELDHASEIDELKDLKKTYEKAVDEVDEIRQSFEDKCVENKQFLESMQNQRANSRVWNQSRNLQARAPRHSASS